MDSTITKYLKLLTLKPKSDKFFIDVAKGLTGKTISDPKQAKLAVREKISEGEVKASNDNVAGLEAQVVKEQNGNGVAPPKAYFFKSPAYGEQKAEDYVKQWHERCGKPRLLGGGILIPLSNITKQDKLTFRRINDDISTLV